MASIIQVGSGILEIQYPLWLFILYGAIVGVVIMGILIREIFNCVHPDENIVPCFSTELCSNSGFQKVDEDEVENLK